MELIRNKHGKLTGVIRELAGERERLYTPTGKAIADYDSVTGATYDTDPSQNWHWEPPGRPG